MRIQRDPVLDVRIQKHITALISGDVTLALFSSVSITSILKRPPPHVQKGGNLGIRTDMLKVF